MKKIFFIFLVLFILSCTTEKKVEENLKKVPTLKLTLSDRGLEMEALWRQNLCIEDINADGNLDIIAPPPRGSDKLFLFLGDGEGNWQKWNEIKYPIMPLNYGGIDSADIDGNGLNDLVLACHNGRIYVFLQKSLGKFEDFSYGFPDPTKYSSRFVKFFDYDKDGIKEILTISESAVKIGTLKISKERQKVFKLNLNNKKWEEIPIIPKYEASCFGDKGIVSDFNNDGFLDFATSCRQFGLKSILFLYEDGKFVNYEIESLPYYSYFLDISSGDLNLDGMIDIVVSSMSYEISEKESSQGKSYAKIIAVYNKREGWQAKEILSRNADKDMLYFNVLTVADVNSDGMPDIIAILDDGEIFIYLNKGNEEFEKINVEGFIKRGKAYWIESKDIDRDGRNDIVVAYGSEKTGGKIDVYLNKGF